MGSTKREEGLYQRFIHSVWSERDRLLLTESVVWKFKNVTY